MEHKLWVKIFALLLLGLSALALHDNETSPHSTTAPESPAAALTPVPTTEGPGASPDESSVSNNTNSNNTETGPSSSLSDTVVEAGTIETNSPGILEVNGTIPAVTSLPVSENQTSATQSQQTTASTTLSSTNETETLSPPTSASHLENNSTSQSEAPLQAFSPTTQLTPSTKSSATTTTTTLASPTTTTTTASITTSTTATTTTTTTNTTTTTAARESTQAPAAKEKTTHVQSDAGSHKAISPSQLNVGEETTVVHEGPTLDPLLAGLVSAFIIAAVIITLLLFLKLRRRDTRPEFRRLQDLPMDDMMEDTPLSMYSY